MYRILFQHPVQPLWRWTACLGAVVFKGSASTFEMGIPLRCPWLTQAVLSESCLQHFVRFSTSFPQTETEIDTHALVNFLLHREMRRTLQVDVLWEASTEWVRGDTGFRLCKYTCAELPPVLPCCHFTAYYNFPEKKKICPGIKRSVLVCVPCIMVNTLSELVSFCRKYVGYL